MAGMFPKRGSNDGRSNLVPEQRMDVNGRLVTRHVRADGGASSPSEALLSQTTAGTEASVGLPANVNWDELSPKMVGKMLNRLRDEVKNPDRVWENFDLCTSLLTSKYGPSTYDTVREIKGKIPMAWAAKHGVELGTEPAYALEGDEGFKALYAAREGLDDEVVLARNRSYKAGAEEYNKNQAVSREIAREIGPHVHDYGLDKLQKEMASQQQPSGYRDDVDGIAETVGEFIDAMGEVITERHNGDIPKDTEGTTVAWSDLNPFKRWGKKNK